MHHNSEHIAVGLGSHCRFARMCGGDTGEGMRHSVDAAQDSLRHMAARLYSQTWSSGWAMTCIIIQVTRCQYSRWASCAQSAFSKPSSTIAQGERLRGGLGGPARDESKDGCQKTLCSGLTSRKD